MYNHNNNKHNNHNCHPSTNDCKIKETCSFEGVKPATLNKPYPEIKVMAPNKCYADLLSQDFAGSVSELTAIMQYVNHEIRTSSLNCKAARTLLSIAQAEMSHLQRLGELILLLGGESCGELKFDICNTSYRTTWTPNFIDYQTNLRDMLIADINGEYNAIRQYEKHIKEIDDPCVQANLIRIIEDEKYHITLLNGLLAEIDDSYDTNCDCYCNHNSSHHIGPESNNKPNLDSDPDNNHKNIHSGGHINPYTNSHITHNCNDHIQPHTKPNYNNNIKNHMNINCDTHVKPNLDSHCDTHIKPNLNPHYDNHIQHNLNPHYDNHVKPNLDSHCDTHINTNLDSHCDNHVKPNLNHHCDAHVKPNLDSHCDNHVKPNLNHHYDSYAKSNLDSHYDGHVNANLNSHCDDNIKPHYANPVQYHTQEQYINQVKISLNNNCNEDKNKESKHKYKQKINFNSKY